MTLGTMYDGAVRFRHIAVSVALLLPLQAYAQYDAPAGATAGRAYATWLLRTEEHLNEWSYGNLEEGTLAQDGLTLRVKDRATIFRALPEGFHERVDALKVYVGPSALDEVALLLLRLDDEGNIVKRFRLVLFPDEKTLLDGEYIPLTFYRPSIAGTEVLALSFVGNAEEVTFGGVRFLEYSAFEKLSGMLRSFFLTEGIRPHSVNILLGPVLVPDLGPIELLRESLVLSTSMNAYLLLGLALVGLGLLFRAVFLARYRGILWPALRTDALRRFLLLFLGVWALYDLRMGGEFLGAVLRDHRSFTAAPVGARAFRDRGTFYEFTQFVKPLVADRSRYEVFLPNDWPYFGNLRYETFPALPNADDPDSDTWVIYQRPDIAVAPDGRLLVADVPVTNPGRVMGIFSDHSFVFRESP